jgi:hypothetical protein
LLRGEKEIASVKGHALGAVLKEAQRILEGH